MLEEVVVSRERAAELAAQRTGVPLSSERGPLVAGGTIGTRAYQPGSPPRVYGESAVAGAAGRDRMTMSQYKHAVAEIVKELFVEEDFDGARA